MANILEVKHHCHNRKGPNNLTSEGRQQGFPGPDQRVWTKSWETDGEATPELPRCSLPCCSNQHVKREATNLWRKKKNCRKTDKGEKSYFFCHWIGFTLLQCHCTSESYFLEQILDYFLFWPQGKVLKTCSFRTCQFKKYLCYRQGPILFGCVFVHS